MTDADRLTATIEKIEAEGGRVVFKNGLLWYLLSKIVWLITFGRNSAFLTRYYTTIGPYIGVPVEWHRSSVDSRIAILEHELIHIRQCKALGFGSVWLGLPLFGFLYLLCPLPFGLAWFRYRFEREAYAHGIKVQLRLAKESAAAAIGFPATPANQFALKARLQADAVRQLTTGAYAWTWPFPKQVHKYFDKELSESL